MIADEDGAWGSRRLEARRGVDHVAGDHALGLAPDGHGCLAGEDPGAELEVDVHLASDDRDHLDEVQGGADGALGVVLVGGRGAPQCHHRVADELLDDAAISANDLPRPVEVPGLELADRLRIAAGRDRREPDEVGEQHVDHAAFRRVGAAGRRVGATGDGCAWGT
jgi:hypothetical protein